MNMIQSDSIRINVVQGHGHKWSSDDTVHVHPSAQEFAGFNFAACMYIESVHQDSAQRLIYTCQPPQ